VLVIEEDAAAYGARDTARKACFSACITLTLGVLGRCVRACVPCVLRGGRRAAATLPPANNRRSPPAPPLNPPPPWTHTHTHTHAHHSSILPIPFALSKTGVLVGSLTMLVVAWANDATSCMLIRAAAATGKPTYEALAESAGGRGWKVCVALCVASGGGGGG
jgi:hypothetical protein